MARKAPSTSRPLEEEEEEEDVLVDFATKDDDEKEDAGASLTTIKACVANINGNTIDASALRNVTVMNTDGNLETPIPLTGDKDVVVYLRHLG